MPADRVLRIHAVHDLRVEEADAPDPGPGEVRVAMERGGICGSDLHYFHRGQAGASVLRAPMVLGHEASGRIEALGEGVAGLAVGDRVALDPSVPCGACRWCVRGLPNQCLRMKFLGSAMFHPHEDGAFRTRMTLAASRCVPMAVASAEEAACVEPLAVCLHAARRAPSLVGARVLVTGAGPIGALACAVARAAGAAEVVATDVAAAPLAVASAMGADLALDVSDPAALSPYGRDKGTFDVAFECSGAAAGLASAVRCVVPTGTIVQVGTAGELPVGIGSIVAKEIALLGSFRFFEEFALAARMIDCGRIDVTPILTATMPLADADAAFALAGDRSRAVKVQLALDS